ncbi:MAG TPA: isoprenylcysteine carboxylmethyltransferase family protein [Rhizomicrobium sp.]|nr:isoprenylcysteine carboxylmethyltransferase family protein [Rhizomicrobium sp.]
MPSFRDTKRYDLLTASPLIVFNVFAAAGLAERISESARALRNIPDAMNALALLAAFAFLAVEVGCLVIRKVPKSFSENWLSRAVALAGANAGLALLLLPRASISPAVQAISSFLLFTGATASAYVTIWLGRGFSVFPQARQLTMGGPYRLVRHPLYLSETLMTLGLMLQYRQPWALVMAIVVTTLQLPRVLYEERILRFTYPDYKAYALRTARFLPGIY